jgi:hypothetical protein
MSGFVNGVKRWIFWDFKRGSLQYDIIVALILAFIFLTPRSFLRDQPRPNEVVMMSGHGGAVVFWIDPDSLEGVPAERHNSLVTELVRKAATGRHYKVDRIETVSNSEDVVRGFMAYATEVDE